jgi:hypothetical protein
MPSRHVLTLGMCTLLCGGCQRAPMSPSSVDVVPAQSVYAWSPCVVVQSPGGPPFGVQIQAARSLKQAGKLTWVRLNTHLDGSGREYHTQAREMGLKILSIIHLTELERAGWETAFDTIYAAYPGGLQQSIVEQLRDRPGQIRGSSGWKADMGD